ncbi:MULTISPECIES: endonuclease III [Bombella]|uniref:Endonuclease III n=1 Tax=Bombella saccharophila TaxID=2967338 RepID=A0ABT3W3Q1_9PROT|nr:MULTISPECIES: endonuclease III [Bombella]MCT6837033.1 endonuclease III [Bifidobacteriales bacterium]MCT6855124.1 endonuclease III [Bombella apis]MCX5613674.1 endonuclease III [Bombella saccharophila]
MATSRTKPTTTPKMSLKAVRAFLNALDNAHPDARSELIYHNHFELLVSVVLSAQATDVSVNKATRALYEKAPDPASMAALGEDGIAHYIRTIGLWRSKAHNVALLCQQLLEKHNGHVPNNREALEALPGVGRKTANVVLNIAFDQPTMAVDTHIFRLGNRTGLAPGKTVRAVEDALIARIPKEMLRPAHHWLILHGRYVCKARTPECWRCPVTEWCLYKEKNKIPPKSKTTP